MAYEKTVWKNREVEKPRTFTMTENPDGTITLVPEEGTIIEQGTPIVANIMNNIENGIEEAHEELEKKVPNTREINGKALSEDISLTAADVSAVPTSRTVNSKALSANIALDYTDVTPVVTALTANTTLALTHAGRVLTMSSTSARTITIPANATVAFPIETEIAIININTGALTIAPASGVTLNSEGGKTKITKQYASAALKKTATNTWILAGNISS